MNSTDKLTVMMHGRVVGTLVLTPDSRQASFRYSQEWLHDGFSISPLELPLEDKLFIAQPVPFYGNFGIFEDSLPDGYGRYLLNRMLARKGIHDMDLTVLQRLAIVGSSGMGALEYVPAIEIEKDRHDEKSVGHNLDYMQQLALDVLGEKQTDGADTLFYNSGNSGGCRPKCLIHDEEGEWLVKFRHTYDPQDIGKQEYDYMQLAARCGINIPDCRLLNGKYLATRRFDRAADGTRLHVATAAALLREGINPPMTDYRVLLALTGFLTQSPAEVEQMFRRMVFNVMIENKDDHAKNFSFVCRNGRWGLAPAYDLTRFHEGYHGEHATSVMGKGNPTRKDLVACGATIRITPARCNEMIDEIWNA